MTPTEWLTIGLVVFAGVQVLIQYRDFRERRRAARPRRRSQRIDQARTNLTVEWYRMRRIAQQWNGVDLVQGAEVGQLYPEEILPRDRGRPRGRHCAPRRNVHVPRDGESRQS